MKKFLMSGAFVVFSVLAAGCTYAPDDGQDVYLKNPKTNEVVKCSYGFWDYMVDAVDMCVSSREKKGFVRVRRTPSNDPMKPYNYEYIKDPTWDRAL